MRALSPGRGRTLLAAAATAVAIPLAMLTAGAGTALADPTGGGVDFIGPTPQTPSVPQACVAACAGVINMGTGGGLVRPAPAPSGTTPVITNPAPLGGSAPSPGGGVTYTIPGGGPNGNLPSSGSIPTGTGGGGGGLLLDDGYGTPLSN